MKVDEIIQKPMTTLEHPDPTQHARYIRDDDSFYGYDYVFVEDAILDALYKIARAEERTVDELCADIDLNFAPGADFAPAARAYVLRTVAPDLFGSAEQPAHDKPANRGSTQ